MDYFVLCATIALLIFNVWLAYNDMNLRAKIKRDAHDKIKGITTKNPDEDKDELDEFDIFNSDNNSADDPPPPPKVIKIVSKAQASKTKSKNCSKAASSSRQNLSPGKKNK